MDLELRVRGALEPHPAVRAVTVVGSRAGGSPGPLSDWDFVVDAVDFHALAEELKALVAPLEPLAQQWDRYSDIECYMLMLPGAVKVDLLFPDRPHVHAPPWEVSAATLEAVDVHFWDWILWIAQKAERAGGAEVAELLEQQHGLLLRPMGVERVPATVGEALGAYLAARETLARRFAAAVPKRLGDEVLTRLAQHGHAPKPPRGVPRDP